MYCVGGLGLELTCGALAAADLFYVPMPPCSCVRYSSDPIP